MVVLLFICVWMGLRGVYILLGLGWVLLVLVAGLEGFVFDFALGGVLCCFGGGVVW